MIIMVAEILIIFVEGANIFKVILWVICFVKCILFIDVSHLILTSL